MIRLLFADDHQMFRQGLHRLLQDSDTIEIVAECAGGVEALTRIRELQPDVAVLDLSMPDMGGLEVLAAVRAEANPVPVIILTMHEDPIWSRRAIAAGVNGFVLKDDAFTELIKAVYTVLEGKQYLSGKVAEQEPQDENPLTARELQVLRLICRGNSNRKIAEALEISMKTVDSHRTSIMKKLKLHSIVELVRWAIRHQHD
ncbi:MAG: response regulator transcription factor [Geobacter sp.]|jgi:DNA-binding NarL/FixJ family response regulator|nr:response regulator transcription factor [Geobacter sp.]